MENNKKENKTKYVLIASCVIVVILIIVIFFIKSNNKSIKSLLGTNLISNNTSSFFGNKTSLKADLQAKCSTQSQNWFKNSNYKQSDTYVSHFNEKLNKCFILITSQSGSKKDENSCNLYSSYHDINIDLYEVLESKHYAMYNGEFNCPQSDKDRSIYKSSNGGKINNHLCRCKNNTGIIWKDGNDKNNDESNKDIFHLPSNDLTNVNNKFYPSGDGNIQNQFINAINSNYLNG